MSNISSATRWRSTLYEMCPLCYVLLVCVLKFVYLVMHKVIFLSNRYIHSVEQSEGAAAGRHRAPLSKIQDVNMSTFIRFSHSIWKQHLDILLISICIKNYKCVTVPWVLPINTFVLTLCATAGDNKASVENMEGQAKLKDKWLFYAPWQLVRRPSIAQAYTDPIKYCTILVHPDPSGQED